jgi:hypothetical protein
MLQQGAQSNSPEEVEKSNSDAAALFELLVDCENELGGYNNVAVEKYIQDGLKKMGNPFTLT